MDLYICTDVNQCVEDLLDVAIVRLPPQRCEYALRYRNRHDKALCVAAYLLLRYALKCKYGLDYDGDLSYTVAGKPYLEEYDDIEFSLSHSNSAVACAISGEAIGVDIERVQSYDADVAQFCCNADELEQIAESGNPGRKFTEIWTRKESAIKQVGAVVQADLKNVAEMQGKHFYSIEIAGYICTVCTAEESMPDVKYVSMQELLADIMA